MEIKTDIKISPELFRLGERIEEAIETGLLRAAGAVEAAVVEEAPKSKPKGGNLADPIRKYLSLGEKKAIITATAPYSIFVHQGTGIYGPSGQPFQIRAKNKMALFWPGAKHPVKSVTPRGQKPNPFMNRALDKVKDRLPGIFSQAINE